MNVRVYPDTNAATTTRGVGYVDASQAPKGSASMRAEHRTGDTVDKVDQLSSVTLLGLAIVGTAVMLVAHWLIG